MKLVKNCIKKCQYCDDYQSILSDVDKHQRTCPSNPHKDDTLVIDDKFDENKFLKRFAGDKDLKDDDVRESQDLEESKDMTTTMSKVKSHQTSKNVSAKLSRLDLNKYEDDDQFDTEPNNLQNNDNEESDSSSDPEPARVQKPKLPTRDDLMILPHLHKHDLVKKRIYNKPSSWICGGYFTRLGCLNSFECLFKQIDFEFPHYE